MLSFFLFCAVDADCVGINIVLSVAITEFAVFLLTIIVSVLCDEEQVDPHL